jgi:hypothetical protein
MKKQLLYKVLKDGRSAHGGALEWSLPSAGTPGNWHTFEGELSICRRGIHLTKKPLRWYVWGCTCYLAEAKGIREWEEDKCVCRSARLLEEAPHPQWWLDAIGFVESLKNMKWFDNHGEIDPKWKMFDTWGAAWEAIRGATWGATWGAAWGVVRDAARDAAWEAIRDAARDATRGAAWDAARDAAWGATRAAAWDAAWDAARGAAWGAALKATFIVTADLKIEDKHRTFVDEMWHILAAGYGYFGMVEGVHYVYRKP